MPMPKVKKSIPVELRARIRGGLFGRSAAAVAIRTSAVVRAIRHARTARRANVLQRALRRADNLAGSAAGVHHSCKLRSALRSLPPLYANPFRDDRGVPARSGSGSPPRSCSPIAVTLASWEASPVSVQRAWWMVWVLCLSGSAATALPLVALASVLVARAYPTRPAVAAFLLGLGAGVIADAAGGCSAISASPRMCCRRTLAACLWRQCRGRWLAIRLGKPFR